MFYGIITSANVAVPIDIKLTPKDMTDRLDFADVSIVFLSRKFAYLKDDIKKACPKVGRIMVIEEYVEQIPEEAFDETLLMVYPDQVSLLLFTSGTTGNGFKAAMITQGSLLSGVRDYAPIYRPGCRVLSVLPLHHCFELFLGQMKASYSGTTIYINNDITELMRDLAEFKPDSMVVVPAVAKMLCSVIINGLKAGSYDDVRKIFGGNLKRLALGGAASGREMVETLAKGGITAYNGYGLTESSGGCLINLETDLSPEACGLNPYGNVDIKIEDGELMLHGPYIVKGYYKQPELTASVFENGWLHTGDMARLNDDGKVVILGRKDNMINLSNGEKVYPEQWEERLAKLGGVRACMVCAIEDHLVAVIKLAEDSNEIRKFIRGSIDGINETLPGYEKIMDVRFREEPFPMTSSMKIKRAVVIKELSGGHNGSVLYVPPKDDSQIAVIEKVKQVLPELETIGITDNLYERGLGSLTTLNLALLLSCSPTVIYECKTVEKIAERINIAGRADIDEINRQIKKPGINKTIKNAGEGAAWNDEGAILITGATGYLGPHILKELTQAEGLADHGELNRKIYCLVRSGERFIKTCDYYGVDLAAGKDITGAPCKTVEAVEGDLTEPGFGLPDDEYSRLCEEVSVVFHCAASVAHAGSTEESYEINVKGTEEVLKFCLSSGAQLYHMSSYAVTGFNTDKALTED
ncbi:MAG: AMP-binding protein, partial [Lachnospiraceae bacterium]|nr:AMP-binding protein [Lachnospiraceae bacterium]